MQVVPAFCNWQIVWYKGKKYILENMKKNVLFMISFDYLGLFREGGVNSWTFFLFEPLFLSYRTNKLPKDNF